MLSKLTQFVKQSQYHIFLAICIGLISFISYNLGEVDSLRKNPIKIGESLPAQAGANIYGAVQGEDASPKVAPKPLDMRVVVSKSSSSKKYHHSWCGSWKKIKPENQLWFNSDKEAETAGYTLAGNCTK